MEVIKFIGIYKTEAGWWHCQIERDGILMNSSLRTKNEREANRKAEQWKRDLCRHGAGVEKPAVDDPAG